MASKKENTKAKTEEVVISNEQEAPTPISSFIEDPLNQAESFYTKYKKQLNLGGTILLGLILAFFGWKYYISSQENEAQSQMFQAVYYFEADSLSKALNGDGNYPGLIEIADDYGLTNAGNLAKFYVGTAFLKQGKYEDAISYLKDFSSNDLLVQARAYSLLGDAYMELAQYAEAVNYYHKATNYKPNKEFTPTYMLKLALAQEKNKDNEGALSTYNSVLEKYPNSAAATDAKKNKGYLESILEK